MLYHFAVAIISVFILLTGWVAIEHWARKKAPRLPDECDGSGLEHSCSHCIMADTCAAKPQDTEEPGS